MILQREGILCSSLCNGIRTVNLTDKSQSHSEEGGEKGLDFNLYIPTQRIFLFCLFPGKLHDTNIYECQVEESYSICLADVLLNEFSYAQGARALMNRSL